ncbi:hypothetical protein MKK55_12965 [Methylobacterium sp. J-059]|uniref:transcription termination/antitermination protein NusG n=1 Tax=Methylobacterium sp. J-059 TaxID=2836643 RepID=UPI001FBBB9AE|nr:hypothetical protein [Methylobacterium sp. J-059]MCJ2039843.1 hypothetical protein [Methylobacterium sp. J-059]
MPSSRNGRAFDAKATPQHNAKIALDKPIEEGRRNVVPNFGGDRSILRWYIATTAPSRELSAAASIRGTMLSGDRAGETPFAAYVPCEFFWRRSVRSNLRVPRRERQFPILRHYLFLGVMGGLCDDTLAALRQRDGEDRNVHGLIGILGSQTRGPLQLNRIGMRWLRDQGADEVAGRTNRTPIGAISPGEAVRATSGPFAGFIGQFVSSADGGTVGVISLTVMGSACDIRLPIEDVERAA